jgi:hypothetical protein
MRHAPVLGLILAVALTLGVVPASAKVLITVDKSTQQMNVSVDGVQRWTWPVSTGIPRYDTPSGNYRAFRMEADHFSKEWDDAPMPHSIFFTQQGHAIHGYLNTRNIGNPASHGCVRLDPGHAAQLYALVQQQGVLNTTVVLTGDVQVAMARRATRTASRNDVPAPQSLQPEGYGRGYGSPRPAYDDQPYQGGYQQRSSNDRARAEYSRTYDNCPPPPPGFPTPACAAGRERAVQAAPRRYDYGQPQYEPETPWPFFGRTRASGY